MKHLATSIILSLAVMTSYLPDSYAAISEQKAANIATQRVPGRVVSVNSEKRDGTPVYRVKILDSRGGLHTIIIHADSGDILTAN